MKSKNLLKTLLVLGLLLSSPRLFAYTLTYTGLRYGSNATLSIGGTSVAAYAGEIAFSFTGSAGTPSGMPTSFYGYCVELEQELLTNTTVKIMNTDSLTRNGNVPYTGSKAAWLYNTYASTINNNADGAGLQIAIWKSLYDKDFNLSTGYFQVLSADASVIASANKYLANLTASKGSGVATWFYGTGDSINGQDVMGPYSSSFGYPVPEPNLLSLLSCASVSGLVLIRKRYRRRH